MIRARLDGRQRVVRRGRWIVPPTVVLLLVLFWTDRPQDVAAPFYAGWRRAGLVLIAMAVAYVAMMVVTSARVDRAVLQRLGAPDGAPSQVYPRLTRGALPGCLAGVVLAGASPAVPDLVSHAFFVPLLLGFVLDTDPGGHDRRLLNDWRIASAEPPESWLSRTGAPA